MMDLVGGRKARNGGGGGFLPVREEEDAAAAARSGWKEVDEQRPRGILFLWGRRGGWLSTTKFICAFSDARPPRRPFRFASPTFRI